MSKLLENSIRDMAELVKDGNSGENHNSADIILCHVLTELGYGQLVEKYHELEKWYE